MRLIDADALVDDGLRFQDGYDNDGIMMVRLWDVIKCIRNAPTIDAVPVVRCRECKWGTVIDTAWHPCTEMSTNDNWFCADGKRKDGADNG